MIKVRTKVNSLKRNLVETGGTRRIQNSGVTVEKRQVDKLVKKFILQKKSVGEKTIEPPSFYWFKFNCTRSNHS